MDPPHLTVQHVCAGEVGAVEMLLCGAQANPLLTREGLGSWSAFYPLDMAAGNGRVEVVRKLIEEVGIEGCGGYSGGATALELAARDQHVEVMELLTDAGAVDTGFAMITAAQAGRESSIKFLLQRREEKHLRQGSYAAERFGVSVWFAAIRSAKFSTSRIVRMLIDAGTDTDTDGCFEGEVLFHGTPLGFANKMLREKKVFAEEATEAQLHNLEATRRLLLRVEAVRAVSWLWPSDARSVNNPAVEGIAGTKRKSAPLTTMLPILRRRTRRRAVLRGALLSRWVMMTGMAGDGLVINFEAPLSTLTARCSPLEPRCGLLWLAAAFLFRFHGLRLACSSGFCISVCLKFFFPDTYIYILPRRLSRSVPDKVFSLCGVEPSSRRERQTGSCDAHALL